MPATCNSKPQERFNYCFIIDALKIVNYNGVVAYKSFSYFS